MIGAILLVEFKLTIISKQGIIGWSRTKAFNLYFFPSFLHTSHIETPGPRVSGQPERQGRTRGTTNTRIRGDDEYAHSTPSRRGGRTEDANVATAT